MRSTRGSGGVWCALLVLWYVCVVVCVCVPWGGVRGDFSFPLTSLPSLPVVGSTSSISIRGGSFSSAGYTFGNGQVLILADPDAAALVAPAPPMTLTFTLQSMSMTFGSQLVLITLANDRLDRVCRVFVNVPTPTLTFELRDQQTGAVVRTTTSWTIPLNDPTPITITIELTTNDGVIKNDRGQFQTFRYLQTPTTPLQPFTVGQLVIGDGFTGGSGWSGTIRDFSIVAQASGSGDPQFLGFHGQSFQVHGFPDEIMNLVTMKEFQWNSLFVYLDGSNRVMTRERYNHTQRYSHPGTYLGELYFNTPFANLRIRAGPHELGLTVFNDSHVVPYEGEDGGNVITHQFSDLTLSMISKDRVVIQSQYLSITVDNSDWFVNIGVHQHGLKQSHACGTLTARKTQHLSADDPYHTTCTLHDVNTGEQVHMHGLIGGTYRNIRFAQGRLYEGSPDDYHVTSGSSSGTDFAFNLYRGVAGTGHHHAGTH